MNILAFDIECANSFQGKGKICSFGYCLADENFRVIEKADMLINPKAKFHLRGKGDAGGIDLAYDQAAFDAAPKFSARYDEIRALLEAPDTLVIGHSVMNDIRFLRYECQRYRRPNFIFRFVDAQQLYCVYRAQPIPSSLEKIATAFKIAFTAHKSDDDAYATLLYFQKICEAEQLSPEALMQAYDVQPGESEAEVCVPPYCGKLREMTDQKTTARHMALESFRDFAYQARPNGKVDRSLKNKRICFNLALERANLDATRVLIERINERGGKYAVRPRECNVFVSETRDNKRCARADSIAIKLSEGAKIDIVSTQEFLAMIGMDTAALDELIRTTAAPCDPDGADECVANTDAYAATTADAVAVHI